MSAPRHTAVKLPAAVGACPLHSSGCWRAAACLQEQCVLPGKAAEPVAAVGPGTLHSSVCTVQLAGQESGCML
jgi:hypothetical protein